MLGQVTVTLALSGALAVWIVFLLSAVWRLHRKLTPESKPTLWTYINELGGYLLVGIALGAAFLWQVAQRILGQ